MFITEDERLRVNLSVRSADLARLRVFTYVAFRFVLTSGLGEFATSRQHGAGGHDQIHESGEPGCVSSPHRGAARDRHVLHSVVLRLRGDVHKIHTRRLQGAAHLAGRITLHGLRRSLPAALGRNLRLKIEKNIPMALCL